MEGTQNAAGAAEDLFLKALDWARRQGVRSWELRAATSLAGLWRDKERTEEARELLAPVYGQFTERFETTDLKAANRWSTICDGCKTDTASSKMRIQSS
jgi:predicted ATPase